MTKLALIANSKIAILAILIALAPMVGFGNECRGGFVSENSFQRMIQVFLEKRILSSEDIEKMSASPVPLNPFLSKETTPSVLNYRRALDAELSKITNWELTKKGLERFREEAKREEAREAKNSKETREILLPEVIGEIHLKEYTNDRATAFLVDGEPIVIKAADINIYRLNFNKNKNVDELKLDSHGLRKDRLWVQAVDGRLIVIAVRHWDIVYWDWTDGGQPEIKTLHKFHVNQSGEPEGGYWSHGRAFVREGFINLEYKSVEGPTAWHLFDFRNFGNQRRTIVSTNKIDNRWENLVGTSYKLWKSSIEEGRYFAEFWKRNDRTSEFVQKVPTQKKHRGALLYSVNETTKGVYLTTDSEVHFVDLAVEAATEVGSVPLRPAERVEPNQITLQATGETVHVAEVRGKSLYYGRGKNPSQFETLQLDLENSLTEKPIFIEQNGRTLMAAVVQWEGLTIWDLTDLNAVRVMKTDLGSGGASVAGRDISFIGNPDSGEIFISAFAVDWNQKWVRVFGKPGAKDRGAQ